MDSPWVQGMDSEGEGHGPTMRTLWETPLLLLPRPWSFGRRARRDCSPAQPWRSVEDEDFWARGTA